MTSDTGDVCEQLRYGVFLTLITTEAVILCQYRPDAPPGYHGTLEYYYARIADVAIGLAVCLVCHRILSLFTPDSLGP